MRWEESEIETKQTSFLGTTKQNFSSSYDHYFDYFKGFIEGCVPEKDIAFDVKRTKLLNPGHSVVLGNTVVQRGDLF